MTVRRRALLATIPLLPFAAGADDGARLAVPLAEEPPGLIPGLSDHPATRLVGTKIYQGLVRIGPGATVLPDLASLETSPDATRFTFRLRSGLTWHDGAPCTAADAVFSIARFHRALSRRIGPLLAGLQDAQAPDALTATFRFAEPFPAFPFLADALSLPIVAQHLHDRGREAPDPMPWRPVGTGPFQVLAFGRLARFPGFAGPAPLLAEIAFSVMDSAAALARLQAGRPALLVGATATPGPNAAREGQQPPNLARLVALAVNTAAAPLDSQPVRQALSQAIDRAALLREGWGGLGRVATGPLAGISRFPAPAAPGFDVRAASQALTAAELRPDDAGVRARLTLLHPDDAAWPRRAARLAAMLRQVGVDLAAEPLSPAAIAARIAAGSYQLAVTETEQHADPTLDAGSGFARGADVPATARAMVEAVARIWLVEPAIPIVRDRRVRIPGGIYGNFADATLTTE